MVRRDSLDQLETQAQLEELVLKVVDLDFKEPKVFQDLKVFKHPLIQVFKATKEVQDRLVLLADHPDHRELPDHREIGDHKAPKDSKEHLVVLLLDLWVLKQ